MARSTQSADARRAAPLARLRHALFLCAVFIRFTYLGLAATMTLLGAASVTPAITGVQLAGLLGVAVMFHVFAYVLNDVIDLPLDRHEPARAVFPLVQGLVQPWQALGFALAQIPLAAALTAWLGGPPVAYAALAVAFAMLAVYDLWGKRVAFPPLTDLAQGIGWAALALYGASVVPGAPGPLTLVVCAFIVVYVLLINGVHGDLRDLHNDLRHGMRTTALLLGARPQGATGIATTRPLTIYAFTLQGVLIGLLLLPLAFNWLGYGPTAWSLTTGALLILSAAATALLVRAARSMHDRRAMIAAGLLNLLICFGALIVVVALYVQPAFLGALLVAYFGPALVSTLFHDALRWAGQQARANQAPADATPPEG